jgi:hypothetical protein
MGTTIVDIRAECRVDPKPLHLRLCVARADFARCVAGERSHAGHKQAALEPARSSTALASIGEQHTPCSECKCSADPAFPGNSSGIQYAEAAGIDTTAPTRRAQTTCRSAQAARRAKTRPDFPEPG